MIAKDPYVALVNANIAKLSAARAPVQKAEAGVRTVVETAGHRVLLVDFSQYARGTVIPFQAEGYSVHVAKAGSDAIAAVLDLGPAGRFGPVYPGLSVRPKSKFYGGTLRIWESTNLPFPTTLTQRGANCRGNYLTLVISKTPDAEYQDAAAGQRGGFTHTRTFTQAYNSAVNVPSSADDGMSSRGARTMRVTVGSAVGTTIAGGSVRWWWLTPALDPWHLTDIVQVLPTGVRYASPAELEIGGDGGRFFPEVLSFTASAGVVAPEVEMFVTGEGGELNVGDVE